MKPIYVLNGPNMNLLGLREPQTYGSETLADVEAICAEAAKACGTSIKFFQSNYEGKIVETIHEAREQASAIVINPAAYSHTSVAIRDALSAFDAPIVEIHISNIHKREAFRHHSFVSAIAAGVICGCGTQGYDFAVRHAAKLAERAHAKT